MRFTKALGIDTLGLLTLAAIFTAALVIPAMFIKEQKNEQTKTQWTSIARPQGVCYTVITLETGERLLVFYASSEAVSTQLLPPLPTPPVEKP